LQHRAGHHAVRRAAGRRERAPVSAPRHRHRSDPARRLRRRTGTLNPAGPAGSVGRHLAIPAVAYAIYRISSAMYRAPFAKNLPGGRMVQRLAPVTEKPESLTEIVYQLLRDAIISKRLPPGERVSEAGLARQLRVSKTPVREALLRLNTIGLIEADGGRGGRIVRPSAELIRRTHQVRGSLASLPAR